jgi:hypothetical protein
MRPAAYTCAQVHAASRAREVAVFCPYLLVNKSPSPLRVRDCTPAAGSPAVAPPPEPDGSPGTPLMFRRGSCMSLIKFFTDSICLAQTSLAY